MSKIKYMAPALFAVGTMLVCTTATFGKPEYTKKEKTGCVTCHTKANSKELNEVGKCYEKSKALDTCKKK
jgi:hypothetical protein